MELTPEEKQKIYEEEKARIEAREKLEQEKRGTTQDSTVNIEPNLAGLLCYVGAWITGIIFFVLEQKNNWIRFHAAQSIVTFGTLFVVGMILGWIPIIGTVFSSIIGIIVPPSIDMILYGWISGTSIVELFAGGIIPGILVGLSLMALSHWISLKRGYRSQEKFSQSKLAKSFIVALPALVMPILIVGGMFTGIFTATEGASVAVVYGILIAILFYKGLKIKEIPALLQKVCMTIGSIMLLIAFCKTFGWILTAERIPHAISDFFLSNLPYQWLFLFNVILVCLVIGTFLTPAAATIILTPILAPVANTFGIDPVHFGLVLVCSVAIGHVTPPVALTLYIGAGISGISVSQLLKPLVPFWTILFILTLAVAYIPPLTLTLPALFR